MADTPSSAANRGSSPGSTSSSTTAQRSSSLTPLVSSPPASPGADAAGLASFSPPPSPSSQPAPPSLARPELKVATGAPSTGATGATGAPAEKDAGGATRPRNRGRSGSLVKIEKIEPSPEEMLDQSAGFNPNAEWVNYKGAWVIHVVLIILGKIMIDIVPGMGQDTSWTVVNLGYMAISFLMFHWVTGTPFESNSGVYDNLTLWEQIDEGAQYTPAKKWLTSVPIGLFLVSTHYTRYNPFLFGVNFLALLLVLGPKLPMLHRLRFKFGEEPSSPYPSAPSTPIRRHAPFSEQIPAFKSH